ncbi:MAG: four helix bundle protein [Chloroflexi bacterium]|nr:four helix bundle protein [Chloroflexota bacterium]
MNADDLRLRTKRFALRVMKMTGVLPETRAANVIANQILRSATSVGANYRAASRARSPKDFVSKIGIAEEECDETLYWLELIAESKLIAPELLQELMQEANELTAILVASGRTAKQNLQKTKPATP